MKAWAEHWDTMEALVKEIGEFCLQPLPEDGHQGDSCWFFLFLFPPRKASHLPRVIQCSHHGHQPVHKKPTRTFPVL